MRFTDKDKIKELKTLIKHNVLMTNNDYKELKLGLFEDIEDEYCITYMYDLRDRLDLANKYRELSEKFSIVLFKALKALKSGVYIKNQDQTISQLVLFIQHYSDHEPEYFAFGKGVEKQLKPEDYGKTWALTKKELL